MQTPIMNCEFADNQNIVISNYRGAVEPYQPHFLVKQISHAVQWEKTINSAITHGCNVAIEVGAKTVLSNLLRSFPNWTGKSFTTAKNLTELCSSSVLG